MYRQAFLGGKLMCQLHIALWPALWLPLYSLGLATAWVSGLSAAAGYRSNSTARTPLLKLHVSQLKLKPDAAQHSSKRATALRLASR